MKVALLALFAFSAAAAAARELPDYVPICKRTDPEFGNCIKRATAVVQPYMAKGIRELNVPPFEPLVVPMVKLEQGTDAVNYKATLANLKVFGLSNYKFRHVMADFVNGKTLFGKVDIPQVRLASDYSIEGNILILPIRGNGEMTANISNCQADVTVVGQLVDRKGKEYYQAKEVKVKLSFGRATAHFDNLFNGDSVLGMTTNNFLNENAGDILNEIKPALEAVTAMLLEDIINKIFRSQTYDMFFPS